MRTPGLPLMSTCGFALRDPRDHNDANELIQINSDSAHLAHDAAGNMTRVPVPGSETSHHFLTTYDAWNRQATVRTDDATPVTVGVYFYDGLNRRIAKAALNPTDSTNSTYYRTDFYHNENWQVLEERKTPSAVSLATATSATATTPYAGHG
jgi:hypothetical protein